MDKISDNDIYHMRSAINLALTGNGRTSYNPSVGCVIVKNNVILSRARTADGGRPHAETIALRQAGSQAQGTSLYVTLEPCAHHGKTPPCVDAIIGAGVKRVVIGLVDPDPRTSGKSIEKLRHAGIEVIQGVLQDECKCAHSGFITRVNKNRPYTTLKAACTLDGKVALASGESQWITGDLARRHAHLIRSQNDAILVGVGTVLQDNPLLTTRVLGLEHNIKRIILDSNLRIPLDSQLIKSANKFPLLVFHKQNKETEKYKSLESAGAKLIQCDTKNLPLVLELIANQGVNNLLVEGGSKIHSSFLKANLCDELLIYRAPALLGGDAIPVLSDLNIKSLDQRYNFCLYSSLNLGNDVLETYRKEGQ